MNTQRIGWKSIDGYVVKVEIPDDAKRTTDLQNCVCKATCVIPLAFYAYESDVSVNIPKIPGQHDGLIYTIGERSCSVNGIQYFLSRQEAESWTKVGWMS